MSRLVRLYPAAWRDRYEVELQEALDSRAMTNRDRPGLLHGALDAWLDPELADPTGELEAQGQVHAQRILDLTCLRVGQVVDLHGRGSEGVRLGDDQLATSVEPVARRAHGDREHERHAAQDRTHQDARWLPRARRASAPATIGRSGSPASWQASVMTANAPMMKVLE